MRRRGPPAACASMVRIPWQDGRDGLEGLDGKTFLPFLPFLPYLACSVASSFSCSAIQVWKSVWLWTVTKPRIR